MHLSTDVMYMYFLECKIIVFVFFLSFSPLKLDFGTSNPIGLPKVLKLVVSNCSAMQTSLSVCVKSFKASALRSTYTPNQPSRKNNSTRYRVCLIYSVLYVQFLQVTVIKLQIQILRTTEEQQNFTMIQIGIFSNVSYSISY